jgi:hypothetical protein
MAINPRPFATHCDTIAFIAVKKNYLTKCRREKGSLGRYQYVRRSYLCQSVLSVVENEASVPSGSSVVKFLW